MLLFQSLFIGNVLALNSTSDTHLTQNTSYQAEFYQGMQKRYETLDDRIQALSSVLKSAKYVGGSLGEGDSGVYDKDPLVRFDEFDCTTYVETVLAGVMSESTSVFMSNLMALRYKGGQVSFVTRNHFPSVDWIPNNQNKLDDITTLVAGRFVQVAKTTIDKSAWYKKIANKVISCDDPFACADLQAQLGAEGNIFSPEVTTLNYVPLTALFLGDDEFKGSKRLNLSLLDKIPSGSVISMVRPDWSLKKWIGTNMNVSHQGIAIRKDDQLFLRHASERYGKVLDENFAEYFSHYSTTSSLKGFNIQVLKH
jgi:hypothetical protein